MTDTVIRDPLWNNVRVDATAMRLVDAGPVQRLRYVRQLGHAYLVYPGATHSRFEHALGTYHLARRALSLLGERGELADVKADDCGVVRCAALLHDIGHYPFSHALEEIGVLNHEEVARPMLVGGQIADVLRAEVARDAPERIVALVRGQSDSPLQGIISGSLDLDKIEYLKRDALMCGVPYGEIDVERLLDAMVLVDDGGLVRLGVTEKGLAGLESLLFAKYQMYRNVYWHHAVRSATAMYKRLVEDALGSGLLSVELLPSYSDEGLLAALQGDAVPPLLLALRHRQLYKRVLDVPATDVPEDVGEWIAADRTLAVRVENQLASELELGAGELLIDYPEKSAMLGLDIPVRRKGGRVERLTPEWEGPMNLPSLSAELYRSARSLRVFAARPVGAGAEALLKVLATSASEIGARMESGRGLL